ncbi:MAG TPA: hypothetical protein DCX12_08315 [Chloroflexi bacterium]|jgi:hypothetical protein|nr:hypothetical protein [Chloroflexota bacterium]
MEEHQGFGGVGEQLVAITIAEQDSSAGQEVVIVQEMLELGEPACRSAGRQVELDGELGGDLGHHEPAVPATLGDEQDWPSRSADQPGALREAQGLKEGDHLAQGSEVDPREDRPTVLLEHRRAGEIQLHIRGPVHRSLRPASEPCQWPQLSSVKGSR